MGGFRVIGFAVLAIAASTLVDARDQDGNLMFGGRAYLAAPLSADEDVIVNGAQTGTRLKPFRSATGALSATYMARDALGIEAAAAITRHRLHIEDGSLAALDTVANGWFAPLTLTAHYRGIR